MTTNVLAIAPYEGLREMMLNVVSAYPNINLTVEVGDLDVGVGMALKAVAEKDFDIIISRGGTAELLREKVNIPLLEIAISMGDILQGIQLAVNYKEKFAIVGFPSITNHALLICDLMQYQLDVYTIHSAEEVPVLLERLHQQKYSMVLCDMITLTVARRIGIHSMLITSSKESIEEVFRQAMKLNQTLTVQKKHVKQLAALLKNNPNESFVVDADGSILYATLPNNKQNARYYTFVKEAALSAAQQEVHRIEKRIGGKKVSLLSIKQKGCFYIYLDIQDHPDIPENSGICIFNKSDYTSDTFQMYYGASSSVGKVQSNITAYSKNTYPVLLAGEEGTGKDTVANHLYENGPYSDSPFYRINCDEISDKHWNWLMQNADSPLTGTKYTIYFRNIDCLSNKQWQQLREQIEQTALCQRNRVFFSYIHGAPQNTKSQPAILYLMNKLSCLTLYLPPLRERVEDIQSIATLYINQLNLELGKQIIGFEAEALTAIESYPWPQNLNQFKRVLRELVVSTEGFYIQLAKVQSSLKKEKRLLAEQGDTVDSSLNLDQTLDQITYDIVLTVLAQEKGNQKKAAQRLGISRTTIWRIIKSKE